MTFFSRSRGGVRSLHLLAMTGVPTMFFGVKPLSVEEEKAVDEFIAQTSRPTDIVTRGYAEAILAISGFDLAYAVRYYWAMKRLDPVATPTPPVPSQTPKPLF
jgi:hypothetical protein